jgi:hypothetical protein
MSRWWSRSRRNQRERAHAARESRWPCLGANRRRWRRYAWWWYAVRCFCRRARVCARREDGAFGHPCPVRLLLIAELEQQRLLRVGRGDQLPLPHRPCHGPRSQYTYQDQWLRLQSNATMFLPLQELRNLSLRNLAIQGCAPGAGNSFKLLIVCTPKKTLFVR